MPELLHAILLRAGLDEDLAFPLSDFGGLAILILLAVFVHYTARTITERVSRRAASRTSNDFDDTLVEAGVFRRLAHLAPALIVTVGGPALFVRDAELQQFLRTAVNVYLVIIFVLVLSAILNAVVLLYDRKSTTKSVPLKGFTQAVKLVVFLFASILILSQILGRSPVYFLSGLGALTAVLLLIFKDAILGLVAGIQISVNQMIRIGDWIEMPKYGADGDVIDVTLTTVKVRNWDKTISTVPTYALISDPVKNWRGMFETGGRRIKRAVYLDMTSVRFLDDELLRRMLAFRRLRPYLEQKIPEIQAWNEQHGEDTSIPVNGRRLTNIGCLRAYCLAYLQAHPGIHQGMTILVRQLQPTDHGLPLEIWCFTNDTRWAVYEGIQADIFDHLLAVIPEFDLRVFQSPGSHDVRTAVASLRQAARESLAEAKATNS